MTNAFTICCCQERGARRKGLLFLAVLGLTVAGYAPAQVTKATFANVVKLNAYVDNWCMIYINGKLEIGRAHV